MSSILVSPSILAADLSQAAEEVAKITAAKAEMIHFDIMDGHFVPNLTFGADFVRSLRSKTKLLFDVHLMIERVAEFVPVFAQAGADIITFHYEAVNDQQAIIELIHQQGCKAGIALRPQTPVETLIPLLPMLDLVLVMSVNPGFAGQKFMANQLSKVAFLREKVDKLGKEVILAIDGGINNVTAKEAIKAGADMLVAGSYIFQHQSYQEAINSLREK